MLSKLPKTPVQPKTHQGPQITNVKSTGIKTLRATRYREHMVYPHCKGTVKYREQSKSCFSRFGKQHKPGTWVITPTPAPSKHVPVVVLPRKTEYGPCEKQNIPGSQGTLGLYVSPRSQEETQGSKEEPPGSYTASRFRKKLEPLCSLGSIGVITTSTNHRVPKNDLRIQTSGFQHSIKKERTPMQPRAHRGRYIPKEPLGSHATSGSNCIRAPIQSPDLRNNTAPVCDLRVQSQP
ncbi:hypothetical protein F2Q69_00042531 [Brassica cretica]|uniref:Uncharacterized protein n=1 Tax=Brassica cretica TaxID=69181 RepID=A0A8S9N612_BRACR|nr:hypothetical protein F2Q69_00042531 [Brassica cretica]